MDVIIPARFASSRFPGKPLAKIAGVPLVVRVAEQCRRARHVRHITVATDHQCIGDLCGSNGIASVMTSADHQSGLDRVAEASSLLNQDPVMMVQGDEPVISPDTIDDLIERFHRSDSAVLTGINRISDSSTALNPNMIKVAVDARMRILYMSRLPIPSTKEGRTAACWRHVGAYIFASKILLDFHRSGMGLLEKTEGIEPLRFIENGIPLVGLPVAESLSVDIPEDILSVEEYLCGASALRAVANGGGAR